MIARSLIAALNRIIRPFDVEIVRRSDAWRPLALLGKQPAPEPTSPSATPAAPYLRVFGQQALRQDPAFDVSVVMPSVLRDTIREALRSVFAQDLQGRVQTLIGVDRPHDDSGLLDAICTDCPPNHSVMVLYPGYSTSARHGGLHPAWDGGALRTVLTYLAHSRHVAYLDDDNSWAPNHLSSLRQAIEGHEWAWSRRCFIHPVSRVPICEDEWESVGPGRHGRFGYRGGWVDPNCLMIDKIACEAVIRWWGIPLRNSGKAMDADRNVFELLAERFRGQGTGLVSTYYVIHETDPEHPHRLAAIGEERYRAAGRT